MNKGIAKGLVAVGLGLAIVAAPLSAQKPGPEFGIQFVGFQMNNPDGDNNNSTDFGLGSGDVSVAFYLTEMIAIEPTLVYGMSKPEGGGDAASAMGFQVAVPIYFSRGWGKAGGLFVAPHIGLNRFDGGPGDAISQTHFGASLGTKLKVSDQIFWRVQGGFDMGMEKGNLGDLDFVPKYTDIGASFGLSVYLH